MHKGWRSTKLKDVATIIGGSTPKTSVPEFWGGPHFWVTPAELDGRKFISSTERTISDAAVKATNLTLLPVDTVLLSSRAPIGKVAIATVPMYCNQGFKNIVCGDNLNNGFVYYFLKHNVDYLNSLGSGATFKEISKRVVENISIPLPSVEEQHHIVTELDLLSEIIDSKNAQLRDLSALAQSIFFEMFGDVELKEKNKTLDSVCSIVGRIGFRGYTRDDFVDGPEQGAISLSPGNIIDGEMDYSKCSYVTWEKYEQSPEIMIQNGDILVVKTGSSYGKTALVEHLPHKATINPQFVVLKDIQIDTEYLKAFLSTPYARRMYERYVIGTAIPTFSQKKLGSLPLFIPSKEQQVSFSSRVAAIKEQREIIRESLCMTEVLLKSRLDFYFNN